MFHSSSPRRHRFFFALIPPITLARRIANAAHWFETEGTPVRADRLHVTLFITEDRFDAPAEFIATLRAVGASVAAAPVPMALDYVSGGQQSIALRAQHKNAVLDTLYRQITERCTGAGIASMPGRVFSPHMTLGYRNGLPFGERITPLEWVADELVLIHSHLGKTRHEPLGRWPLFDPQLSLFGAAA
jgi:RNA 2',3'-cyclic 3'-phosphodiesterase